MSRWTLRPSPLSITITILLGTAAGAGTALLGQEPEAFRPPVIQAALDMPRPGIAGEPLDLQLEVTNLGPGDAQAPLDGILSLEVVDLESAETISWPSTFLATGEVIAQARGPLLLSEGETTTSLVRLPSLPPLDRPGSFLLRGELYGPAGVIGVAPLRIDVELMPDLARSPCPPPLDVERAAC